MESVTPEQWDAALLGGDLIAATKPLNDEDTKTVGRYFTVINASFFKPGSSKRQVNAKPKLLSRIAGELNAECVKLIQRGHVNVWYYGWEFYLAAQAIN